MPTKLLKATKPLAWPAISRPCRLLPEFTLPSGIGPPTTVPAEVPLTRIPLPPLATTVALSAPTPVKLAWTVVWLELVTRRPLPPLPESTL